MLAAQFAAAFHPAYKGAFGGGMYFGAVQGHILKTLGIVIGVYLAQGFIQQVGKALKFQGFFFKFYDPLMPAAFTVGKVNRGCGIIADNSFRLAAGFLQGTFSIIYNNFFAKG